MSAGVATPRRQSPADRWLEGREAPALLLVTRKQGGRKLVIAPNGTETGAPVRHRVDNAMVKALARGFRWRKLLNTGVYGSIDEITAKEKINSSYVGRLLRLTLLAPDTVEAILDRRRPADMTLAALIQPFALVWASNGQSSPPNSAFPGRFGLESQGGIAHFCTMAKTVVRSRTKHAHPLVDRCQELLL